MSSATVPRKGRDVQIVHHATASPLGGRSGCYFNEQLELQKDGMIMGDLSLDHLLSADGLMNLLCIVSRNFLPLDELLQAIQRIHIPGYEAALPYFADAVSRGEIDPNMPKGFYWQSEIQSVLQTYPRDDD